MLMIFRAPKAIALLAFVVALEVLVVQAASAGPTLAGMEGGLEFPTGELMPDASMAIGVGHIGGSASYLFPPYPNRFYFLSGSVIPGLEFNARFTEVVGLHDPSILLPNFVDRLLSAKWGVPVPTGWPSVAFGVVDLLSINELNRLQGYVPGSSRYGATAYGVVGVDVGLARLNVGYGMGKSYIQGPFAVLQAPLVGGLRGCVEYGNSRLNLGVEVRSNIGLGLKIGLMQGRELGIASSYTLRL